MSNESINSGSYYPPIQRADIPPKKDYSKPELVKTAYNEINTDVRAGRLTLEQADAMKAMVLASMSDKNKPPAQPQY